MALTLGFFSAATFPVAEAHAYETDSLMFYYDFTELSSVGNGTVLADSSGNNRTGTVVGQLTYDTDNKALIFPGGSNGTAYVNLSGDFSDFSSGVTVEFEGEFGAIRSDWERIFDFGNPDGQGANNDFWIGQLYGTNELALETWINGVNQGRCHTVTQGTALGSIGSRAFAKWVVTVDPTSGCRIYKDGVELQTQKQDGFMNEIGSPVLGGTAYPLPAVVDRPTNYLGRSNWPDQDLEGSIRYIRLYSKALTPSEVLENATNPNSEEQIPGENGSSGEANNESGTLLAETGTATLPQVSLAIVLASGGLILWRLRRRAS